LPSVQKNLRGLDACLVGFHMSLEFGDEPMGIMSVEAKRMFSFKSSMTSLLSGWFEMRALEAPTLEESTAKVFCIMESTFDEMLSADWLEADSGTHQAEKSPPLVLRTEPYQSCPSYPIPDMILSMFSSFELPRIIPSLQTMMVAQQANDGIGSGQLSYP
jgi:hypothetical protein